MHFCELLKGRKAAWCAGADAVPHLSTWLRDAAVQPQLMCVVVAARLWHQSRRRRRRKSESRWMLPVGVA